MRLPSASRTFLLLLPVAALCPGTAAAWPPDESKGPIDYADPVNWPNDPGFGGMWSFWSFLPREAQNRPGVSAQNKRIGAGSHLDRAWAKTTGDRRVLISVL